jgi:uncharacterized membrane protein YdjX (TVP38/TMEM64 family)
MSRDGKKTHKRDAVRRLLVFAVFAMGAVLLSIFTPLRDYLHMDRMRELAEYLGYAGPAGLILMGILTPLLFLPRWPICIVAGLLYGIGWGTLLSTFASTMGAWLHFRLARYFLGPMSQRILEKAHLAHHAVAHDKMFFLFFFLRAFPLSNFVATNLLAGALHLPTRVYISATFLGMLPASLMYVSWGKLMKQPSPDFYAVAAFSLLFIATGTLVAQRRLFPWVRRSFKRPKKTP